MPQKYSLAHEWKEEEEIKDTLLLRHHLAHPLEGMAKLILSGTPVC